MSKNSEKDWSLWHECAIIRSEAAVATNELRPLKQNVPDKEVTHMPFEHDYGDSTPKFNPEQSKNGGAA